MFEQLTTIFSSAQTNLQLLSISQKQREDFVNLILRITETPRLPLSEIHKLCINQERKIMNRILSVKPIDLYEEISNVCPLFADLKNIPLDQVKAKIIQFTQNLEKEQSLRKQEYEMESVSMAEQDQDDICSLNEIVPEEFPEMQLIEEDISNRNIELEKDIDNMFAQELHTGLPWADFGYYGTDMSD